MRLIPYEQVMRADNEEELMRYAHSLLNPWGCPSKIPLGFPVKSAISTFTYKMPLNISGTTITIGTASYTTTSAGSSVGFWFNPNMFDNANLFQISYTASGLTLFSNWSAVAVSKGYATQMASYRVVSAGIKFIYTGAQLYAKGQLFSGATNARSNTDYGGSGFSNFVADPDTIITPLASGATVKHTFMPIDLDSMSFISTTVTDANFSDWSVFLAIDSYDSVNGASGYFDICVNYETIPYGTYEQLLGPTMNPGGTHEDVKRAVDAAKKQKDVIEGKDQAPHRPTEEISRQALDWIGRYGKLLPFP